MIGTDPAQARRRRNMALAAALALFALLVFIVTMVRLGGGAS
jgi:hypothetical protein